MKLAICDDERVIRDTLAKCVREVAAELDDPSEYEIECFADARKVVTDGFEADILFLDIQMPEIDGMKAARLIRLMGKKTVIIFVTALEEYVFNAFDVGAFQYIVKPFDIDRVKEIIRLAIKQSEEQHLISEVMDSAGNDGRKSILVKNGGINMRILLSDIAYAEVFDHRIVLHTQNMDTVEYYGKLADLEDMAGRDFYRAHRAYLINLAHVKSYDSKSMTVLGTEIPLARGKYQEFVEAYLSYHTRQENF